MSFTDDADALALPVQPGSGSKVDGGGTFALNVVVGFTPEPEIHG